MRLIILSFATFFMIVSYCQTTIWSEDFSSYVDGAVVGANNNTSNPANDWTSTGCTTCPASSNDWWEVRSGRFEARDVNNEYCSIQTEVIDVSAYTTFQFSVDVTETGDHEGPYLNSDICADQSNEDFADVEYRIDGGAWILIGNYLGWCGLYASCNMHTFYGDDNSSGDCRTTDLDWVASNVFVGGLSGSTVELRFSATNSSGTEYIQFDNILVQGLNPLPVELISFSATPSESFVQLDWVVGSETDNDFFTLEKSRNGYDWTVLSIIDGVGNSSFKKKYSEFDYAPSTGIVYYRLKQTDYDGKSEYLGTRSVEIQELLNIGVYPNPANTEVVIAGVDLIGSEMTIFNEIGEIMYQSSEKESQLNLNLDSFKPGVYHIMFVKGAKMSTKKLVVI